MRKILLVIFIIAIITISAGCVNTYPPEYIVGTWTVENHTNSEGVHYTKIVDVYNADRTMNETLYVDNGKVIKYQAIWEINEDRTYTAYYRSLAFDMNFNGKKGTVNSDVLQMKDLVFERVDGDKGFVGSWTNSEPHEFRAGYNKIKLIVNFGGTGNTIYIKDDGTEEIPINFQWTEIGKNMFVISFSKPMEIHIDADGHLCDNFGLVYTKSE